MKGGTKKGQVEEKKREEERKIGKGEEEERRGRREEGKGEQTRKIHQSLQCLLCNHKGLNLISRNVRKPEVGSARWLSSQRY